MNTAIIFARDHNEHEPCDLEDMLKLTRLLPDNVTLTQADVLNMVHEYPRTFNCGYMDIEILYVNKLGECVIESWLYDNSYDGACVTFRGAREGQKHA